MTQWIKYLLSKHESGSLIPRTHKSCGDMVATHNPRSQDTETGSPELQLDSVGSSALCLVRDPASVNKVEGN